MNHANTAFKIIILGRLEGGDNTPSISQADNAPEIFILKAVIIGILVFNVIVKEFDYWRIATGIFDMLRSIKQFVETCSETLPILEPIYEFGAFQVPGQEGLADLRPYFKGKTYIGTDIQPGAGVDKIIDLHDIELPDNSVGTALILETLEHVEYPRKAVKNAHRVLDPKGILIFSSPMNFPIHDFPNDYWRFTPEGMKSLMEPFSFILVDFYGEPEFPQSIVGFASKSPVPAENLARFTTRFELQKKRWLKISNALKEEDIKKLTPREILTIDGPP